MELGPPRCGAQPYQPVGDDARDYDSDGNNIEENDMVPRTSDAREHAQWVIGATSSEESDTASSDPNSYPMPMPYFGGDGASLSVLESITATDAAASVAERGDYTGTHGGAASPDQHREPPKPSRLFSGNIARPEKGARKRKRRGRCRGVLLEVDDVPCTPEQTLTRTAAGIRNAAQAVETMAGRSKRQTSSPHGTAHSRSDLLDSTPQQRITTSNHNDLGDHNPATDGASDTAPQHGDNSMKPASSATSSAPPCLRGEGLISKEAREKRLATQQAQAQPATPSVRFEGPAPSENGAALSQARERTRSDTQSKSSKDKIMTIPDFDTPGKNLLDDYAKISRNFANRSVRPNQFYHRSELLMLEQTRGFDNPVQIAETRRDPTAAFWSGPVTYTRGSSSRGRERGERRGEDENIEPAEEQFVPSSVAIPGPSFRLYAALNEAVHTPIMGGVAQSIAAVRAAVLPGFHHNEVVLSMAQERLAQTGGGTYSSAYRGVNTPLRPMQALTDRWAPQSPPKSIPLTPNAPSKPSDDSPRTSVRGGPVEVEPGTVEATHPKECHCELGLDGNHDDHNLCGARCYSSSNNHSSGTKREMKWLDDELKSLNESEERQLPLQRPEDRVMTSSSLVRRVVCRSPLLRGGDRHISGVLSAGTLCGCDVEDREGLRAGEEYTVSSRSRQILRQVPARQRASLIIPAKEEPASQPVSEPAASISRAPIVQRGFLSASASNIDLVQHNKTAKHRSWPPLCNADYDAHDSLKVMAGPRQSPNRHNSFTELSRNTSRARLDVLFRGNSEAFSTETSHPESPTSTAVPITGGDGQASQDHKGKGKSVSFTEAPRPESSTPAAVPITGGDGQARSDRKGKGKSVSFAEPLHPESSPAAVPSTGGGGQASPDHQGLGRRVSFPYNDCILTFSAEKYPVIYPRFARCSTCKELHIDTRSLHLFKHSDTCLSMLPEWFPKVRFPGAEWATFDGKLTWYWVVCRMLDGIEFNRTFGEPYRIRLRSDWEMEFHEPSAEWTEVGYSGGWRKCRVRSDDPLVPAVERECKVCTEMIAVVEAAKERGTEVVWSMMGSTLKGRNLEKLRGLRSEPEMVEFDVATEAQMEWDKFVHERFVRLSMERTMAEDKRIVLETVRTAVRDRLGAEPRELEELWRE